MRQVLQGAKCRLEAFYIMIVDYEHIF